jgi:hypothetical protein
MQKIKKALKNLVKIAPSSKSGKAPAPSAAPKAAKKKVLTATVKKTASSKVAKKPQPAKAVTKTAKAVSKNAAAEKKSVGAKAPAKKVEKLTKSSAATKAQVKSPAKELGKKLTTSKENTKTAKVTEKKGDKKAAAKTSKDDKNLDKASAKSQDAADPKATLKALKGAKPAKGAKERSKDVDDDPVDFDDDNFDNSEIEEYEIEDEADVELEVEISTKAPYAPSSEAETRDESDEVFLTDAEGRRYCRVKDCDQISAVDGYCRYHYLLLWKKIQVRKKILSEGKLERYVEDLTARYPDKYLEMLRKDLRNEKEFLAAIQELEIDDTSENELEDETQSYIEEVRGMSGDTPTRDDDEF